MIRPLGTETSAAASAHDAALPAGTVKTQAAQAAKQLESFFLNQMLSEARPENSDGGFAGDTFKQMLDQQLADKMAGSGGIGLAKVIEPQLLKASGGTAAATELNHGPIALPSASAISLVPGVAGQTASAPTEIDGAMAPGLIRPITGRAASGFGPRIDPINHTQSNHPGVDLAAPTGTPVAAAAGGKVTHAGPAGTYGNLVILKHENGFETRYAHLSEVTVKEGETVKSGDEVGKVGTTGRSTGPHLHFEVRHAGKVLDPTLLLPPLNRAPGRTTQGSGGT